MSIAFIGAGNMSRSIIGGLIEQGVPPKEVIASAPTSARLKALQDSLGIRVTQDNAGAVDNAETVVLSVKPQIMRSVCEQLREHVPSSALVISVAAGITCSSLQNWLGEQRAIVRCMPNTPSLIGLGASGLFASAAVNSHQKQTAEQLMSAVGIVQWVQQESQLDVVTAISGSGPAYFFLMLEAMVEAGVEQGLDEATSTRLAIQTARGAAELANNSGDSLADLRLQVTSPGGTTEQAIKSFESDGLRQIVKRAMNACANRAREMAQQLGQ